MKLINKIFICCFMLTFGVVGNAYCEIACLNAIGQDTENFLTKFKNVITDNTILGDRQKMQYFIDGHKPNFFQLVADNIMAKCATDLTSLNEIAEAETIIIPFTLDNKKYDIEVDVDQLFYYIDYPTAILVSDKTNKGPGDKIKKSDIQRGQHFFSSDCSTHNPTWRIPNSNPVNRVGQSVFGSENEYFLDQPIGLNYRSFPGLIIQDIPASLGGHFGSEQVLAYKNYREARQKMKKFADGLSNTACRGLAVYQVKWPRNYPPEKGSNTGLFDLYTPPNLEDDIDEFEILSDPKIIH